MTFGDRLKEMRTKKGWSQDTLSQHLGVFRTLITKYEKGINMPSPDVLIKISKIFDVSLDYLLGVVEEEEVITRVDLENLKREISSSNPDLLSIVKNTRPKVDGIPISDEQLQYLTTFLTTMREQLKKNQDN